MHTVGYSMNMAYIALPAALVTFTFAFVYATNLIYIHWIINYYYMAYLLIIN